MAQMGKLDLLNNRTNQEIAKLALNLHLVFKEPQDLCDPGSVLKRHGCGERKETKTFDHTNRFIKQCNSYKYIPILIYLFFLVKCSAGTFYNSSRTCQPCPYGQYQNVTASLTCVPCPEYTFTKRMHAKSLKDCIRKNLQAGNIRLDVVIHSPFILCSRVPARILLSA